MLFEGLVSFLRILFGAPAAAAKPAPVNYGSQFGPFLPAAAAPAPAAPGYIAPEAALAIVNRLNAGEFAGWFNPGDVMAIIEIESGFELKAYREEPQLQDASRGLMQILLSSARDRGYAGSAAGLYDAQTNIRYGMKQLKWSYDYLQTKLKKRPSKEQWIGSYNAGVGNVVKGYVPQAYINKFNLARKHYT